MKAKFIHFTICIFSFIIYSSTIVFSQNEPPTLNSPTLDETVNSTKPRFTWTGESLTSFELQVCKDSTFKTDVKKFTINKDSLGFTISTTYLDLKTTYYWRMRSSMTATNFSEILYFKIGAPQDTLEDNNGKIILDHSNGYISQITYKKGSNKQLLDISNNQKNKLGLGRVVNESASKIVTWVEEDGEYIYTYENALYGSKTIGINYDSSGIKVDITFNLPASKTIKLNASLLPGGDVGPLHDFILYNDLKNVAKMELLKYPSTSSTIYQAQRDKEDLPGYITFFDDRYDEYAGFKLPDTSSNTIVVQQGPLLTPLIGNVINSKASEFKLQFAVKPKTSYFTWLGQKAIIVEEPLKNSKYVKGDVLNVKVHSFGLSGDFTFKMSSDTGKTFGATIKTNSSAEDIISDNITLAQVSDSCQIEVTRGGIKGYSNFFAVVAETNAKFSVAKNLTASPTDTIYVPILYTQGSNEDILVAFDLRMYYDNSLLEYKSFKWDPYFLEKTSSVSNWQTTDVVINNTSLGFIQVGTFKTVAEYPGLEKNAAIGTAIFLIKSTAKVGTSTSFILDNKYLSATNSSVNKIEVLGSNGLLTFYSKVSGTISYYTGTAKPYGEKLIFLKVSNTKNAKDTTILGSIQKITGNFSYSNIIPGDVVTLSFNRNMAYPIHVMNNITSQDALKAFSGREGGPSTLTYYQKIAADINKDGLINTFDAYAILQMSTKPEDIIKNNKLTRWVFIDQSKTLTETNWTTPDTMKIYNPLDAIQEKQNFLAIMYGDVDGVNAISKSPNLSKSNLENEMSDSQATPELYIPSDLSALPGDTISIPIKIKLNGTNISAINARIKIDNKKFINTNKFEGGNIIPWSNGWVLSNYYDKDGYMNIAATDLGGSLDPIVKDGTLMEFKFVVNKTLGIGDTSNVIFSNYSLSDSKLVYLNPIITSGRITIGKNITDIKEENISFEYSLDQNYPNPFNPSTIISYSIKNEGLVELDIYNVLGEHVVNLVKDIQTAGQYKIEWNASKYASGIYFCKLKSEEFNQTRKLILIK